MRQAAVRTPSRRQVAVGAQIPAPTGGWNAISPLADMPETDAVLLDNWIPRPGYIEVRRGWAYHTQGVPDQVESLLDYRSSGADEIYAAAGDSIYLANEGPVGAAVVTGLTSARWQHVNFANDAGVFLLAFNGADTPLKYDGTDWDTNSISGSDLSSDDLIDAVMHKRRLMMTEKSSLRIWYLDTDAISGTASLLDLGPVFSQGGEIVCTGTWSVDGGAGPDDMFVAMTDKGQVAVYQGTDPSDPDNWALVGVYSLGVPLGRRSLLQYGAELVALTANGVIPLSQAAKYDRSQDVNVALTAKIQNAFAQAASLYQSNFGWDAFLYPDGQIAIYNVPVTELSVSYQFVQNVQTGAWARFKGINAYCWIYANGAAYFGGDGFVARWDTGSADGGQPITSDVTTAFTGFGRAHQLKHFTMVRPIVKAPHTVAPGVDILTDYRSGIPTNVPTVTQSNASMRWGSMYWGSMYWGSSDPLRLDWTMATAIGYVGAGRMRVVQAATGTGEIALEDGSGQIELESGTGGIALEQQLYPNITCQLIAFDLMFKQGGLL